MTTASDQYRDAYLADYGFESVLVHYRRRMMLERMALHRPRVVLDIGCGPELLYRDYLAERGAVEAWVAVEPVAAWSEAARASGLPGLKVIDGYLEDVADEVAAHMPRAPDFVVCAGVLHHVTDVAPFLGAIRRAMGAGSVLHVNVPNVTSLHRRLAVAMGLIAHVAVPSDRNVRVRQIRPYDMTSLASELEAAGFEITARGGHFVKPFTHAQMEAVSPALGESVLDGLYRLGVEDPSLACEIFVEAKKR